jgi:hypothetical protein
MSKLAVAIATEEGFFIPGSIPNRDHNPGDLRHSPHSFHTPSAPNAIGIIDNDADGWEDLNTQLQEYAERGLTIEQMIYDYAPPSDNNNTSAYLDYVCKECNCRPQDKVSVVLAQ